MVFPRKVHSRWLVSKREDYSLDLQCPEKKPDMDVHTCNSSIARESQGLAGQYRQTYTMVDTPVYVYMLIHIHINTHTRIHTQG